MMRLTALMILSCCVGCAGPAADHEIERVAIGSMLDDWHDAAGAADEQRYFAHFAGPEAIFMGTDATERWTRDQFQVWAAPFFERGRAWSFSSTARFIMFDPDGRIAWFDEELETPNLGPCRGSGVVRMVDGAWRIEHYNLSIPIPNDIANDVVDQIRAYHSERDPQS